MRNKYAKIGRITTRVIEECSELIHILCKVERFGWDNYHPADRQMMPNYRLVDLEIRDLCKCLEELEGILMAMKSSCITGKIPKLPYNPTQKEMLELAIQDIKAKKKGRYKLVYDKETRSIIAIDTKPKG